MIPRYTRETMADLWSDETRFALWLEIECHALDAMAQIGLVPQEAAREVRKKARFDGARIAEIEKDLKHDILAFLTNVAEHVGAPARFLHRGLTSSDILDTGFAVQLTRAADILLDDIDKVGKALETQANRHKRTICVGRSHGIHAEPTSFGLKMLQAWAEFTRARARLEAARAEIATCALSGTVGTFAGGDPRIEAYVAKKMKLAVEPVSSQVIPRDRHAMFFATLGVIASSVERVAVEIRHLQRSEVGEVEEAFGAEQKGSSAMPHKKNPVLSENLTGLARITRAYVNPALENVALWHERDISHSSVERMMAPDTTATLDFALNRLADIIKTLVVHKDRMRANLDAAKGRVFSHRLLLALVDKGLAREVAYRLVQKHAMASAQTQTDFALLVSRDKEVKKYLSDKDIKRVCDTKNYLEHVDTIFARVLSPRRGQPPAPR